VELHRELLGLGDIAEEMSRDKAAFLAHSI
jgi:hypothetical protein